MEEKFWYLLMVILISELYRHFGCKFVAFRSKCCRVKTVYTQEWHKMARC